MENEIIEEVRDFSHKTVSGLRNQFLAAEIREAGHPMCKYKV